MSEQPQGTPAGWYPDSAGAGRRWWDGKAWTAHTDAAASAPVVLRPTGILPIPQTAAPLQQGPGYLPPGWHPDPYGSGHLRWWDGVSWFPHLSAPGPGGFVATNTVINVAATKSVGVAFILTFLFGPLGLFYSSVAGGLIMLLAEFILFVLGFVSFGASWLLFGVTWVICIVWGCVAASNSNTAQVVQMTNRY